MFKFLEKVPLYPFLIAVYPILYLLSENISEIGISAGLRSFLIMLVICGAVFLFSLILTRNVKQSGAVTLLVMLVFFLIFFVLYAPVYRGLRNVAISGHILGRHRYLVPATFILLLLTEIAGVLILRKFGGKTLRMISLVSNSIAILLVVIPVVTIIAYTVKNATQISMQTELPEIEQPLTPLENNRPDVYYIILDMHTSDNVMLNLMEYDDSAFTEALKDMGFYVADCSRSNYSSTQYSITSSLNMNYIQEMVDSTDRMVFYPLMQSSLVERSLEEIGYETHAFETGYSFTDLRNADSFYAPLSSTRDILFYPGITPFESLIMQVSGGKILYETREQLSQKMQYIIDASYVQYRDRILYALDTLPSLISKPGPKFVFTHILAPHDPFVFDEEGNPVFRQTPFSMTGDPEGYSWTSFSEAYANEITYLHQRVLAIVEQIITESDNPPVIIIQGDHGLPRAKNSHAQFDIYNAYYFGGEQAPDLYDTITPVNSFRVLFNHYFGTDYSLLPDQSYTVNEETYLEVNEFYSCPN